MAFSSYFTAVILLLLSCILRAQQPILPTASERRAEQAFEKARRNPLTLRTFLTRLPKGGDLHMHLSGSVYAETLIEDARADLLCVDPAGLSFVMNVGTTRSLPPQPVCAEGMMRAANAFDDQKLYDALVDSFSMRAFVPSAGISGHDQFFATFDRFDPTRTAAARHGGAWLDEIASRAAGQNEQYLEIMHTPDLARAAKFAQTIPWPNEPETMAEFHQATTGTSDAALAERRKLLLGSQEFVKTIEADRAEFATMAADRKAREHCGQETAQPACTVDIRFLFQVLRATPPSLAFVQMLVAFEVAEREIGRQEGALVVGLNLVQPEDNRLAMAEYTRQMRMIGYLHTIYPRVHISLHAGEIAAGLVSPEGLRFHIRQAVEVAHAERIGHAVDIMREDDAVGLLRHLAGSHVLAEINITSNDEILGIRGEEHPLAMYRAARVPVALSSDDEGVSRIDLTHEYVRATREFQLGYMDLKQMTRASLEHSFLPGASLWREVDNFAHPATACAREVVGRNAPATVACGTFLQMSPRAAAQWELERRWQEFEHLLP